MLWRKPQSHSANTHETHPIWISVHIRCWRLLSPQYEAICNHNDAVECNLVIFIVQVRQVMCQPRNRVGFSASCTVLNQIIVSGSVCVNIGNELADHIQLVVTWKDHNRLFRILFIFLQMNKSLYNVQQAVFLQDFFPQIRSPVGAVPNRVSLAAVVSLVERQKIGVDPAAWIIHQTACSNSNLQREQILPSEKAFAYKMKLDAMKRQGQRTDLTSATVLQKSTGKTSRQMLAEQVGESHEQIRKYIRLTHLIPDILELVDNSVLREPEVLQIAMRPAVELSYLRKEEQADLFAIMEEMDCTPCGGTGQQSQGLPH